MDDPAPEFYISIFLLFSAYLCLLGYLALQQNKLKKIHQRLISRIQRKAEPFMNDEEVQAAVQALKTELLVTDKSIFKIETAIERILKSAGVNQSIQLDKAYSSKQEKLRRLNNFISRDFESLLAK
ncbi:hypothetical protein BC781_106147 [Sediminitomix flava]|uniref:Uncharacterized protein n=2 Tax=Sediminitomix flava TaxID=379075 RepID=A0A315Z885_SEDFL|nr:hypothetical protein BC781_106147 [Sediminitomix flava]